MPPFQRVAVHDMIDVEVRVGEPQSVSVRADDNFVSWVETRVDDGVLSISWKAPHSEGSSTSVAPRVKIVMPKLDRISLLGTGDAPSAG